MTTSATPRAGHGGDPPVGPEGGARGDEMTLLEHLTELRSRLVRAGLALVVGSAVGWAVFPFVLDLLVAPYCALPQAYRNPTGECALVALRALEPFSVRVKTSMVAGLFVGGPVIFFQLWRFVTPGLTSRERRLSLPFVLGSQIMFAAGILFAYAIIPQGLAILLRLGGEQISPQLAASEYLTFILTTAVAFGLVFELPLLLVFLSLVGLVTSSGLRRFRPYAIVVNLVVAALVTPTVDAVTLLFMAVPMVAFYEGAILAAWVIERTRRRRSA